MCILFPLCSILIIHKSIWSFLTVYICQGNLIFYSGPDTTLRPFNFSQFYKADIRPCFEYDSDLWSFLLPPWKCNSYKRAIKLIIDSALSSFIDSLCHCKTISDNEIKSIIHCPHYFKHTTSICGRIEQRHFL